MPGRPLGNFFSIKAASAAEFVIALPSPLRASKSTTAPPGQHDSFTVNFCVLGESNSLHPACLRSPIRTGVSSAPCISAYGT
jgi:hypothetical protein